MSRNEVAVWDADLARRQAQAELREKAAPKKRHEVNKIGAGPIEISDEAKQKMALAMKKEMEKYAQIADERRRRDPTCKQTASSNLSLGVIRQLRARRGCSRTCVPVCLCACVCLGKNMLSSPTGRD